MKSSWLQCLVRDDKPDKKKHEQDKEWKLIGHYKDVPQIKVFSNHHRLLQ
jgi:hypothetical protein